MRITARVDYAVRAALELAAVGARGADRRADRHRPGDPRPVPAGDPRATCRAPGWSPASAAAKAATGSPCRPSEISIARVMRVEQGFLADVHGQRPEDLDYPGAAAPLGTVWVAARASYRRVLEQVTLADVVAGRLPDHVDELVALENAWRSFGDSPSGEDPRAGRRDEGHWPPCPLRAARRHRVPDRPLRCRQVHDRRRARRRARGRRAARSRSWTATSSARTCPASCPSPASTATSTSAGSASSPARSSSTAAPSSSPRSPPTRRPARRPAPWSRSTAASCWCTCPPRSRSASSATSRASTPRPARARSREFTGISDPYEPPARAEVTIDTSVTPLAESVARIRAAMDDRIPACEPAPRRAVAPGCGTLGP